MKKYILLFFVGVSVILSSAQEQSLSKQVRSDFCYNAVLNYQYGNDGFKALMIQSARGIGLNNIIDIEIAIENINKRVDLQEEFFKNVIRIGGSKEFIFQQFHSIGMTADNAAILADYIIKKYLNKNFVQDIDRDKMKEEDDRQKKLYTILTCENFNDGLALVSIDSEYTKGKTNYGYGKQLFGYIDENGNYAILPQYEQAFSFSDGFALVTTNKDQATSNWGSNWEFINKKGKNIFNEKFKNARSFSEGYAAVMTENYTYGFIDTTGNFISKLQYQEVGDFKDGLAIVKFNNKYGFIDKTGKEIVYPQFTNVRNFSDGLALVSQNIGYNLIQYSYIDKSGNIAIKLDEGDTPTEINEYSLKGGSLDKMEVPLCDFKDGLAIIKKNDGRVVFINKSGETVLKPRNMNSNCSRFNFYQFINGYMIAELCGKYGLLDKKAKWIVKPMFDDIGNFHEGLSKVKLNDNWGFIDSTGNVVINNDILKAKTEIQKKPSYDMVSDFSEGFAIVLVREKFGYIDKLGNLIIEPMFSIAKPFKNGIARVKFIDREGWNYINKKGELLFPLFR